MKSIFRFRRFRNAAAIAAFGIGLSVSAMGAEQDKATIQSYMNQVQSLRSDITAELGTQQSLQKIKDLISEGDKVNKEQSAKLRADTTQFDSDIAGFKSRRAALNDEEKSFDAELDALKAQRDSNQEAIRQHTARYNQHQAQSPNTRDASAVNAYNAEADRLNAEAVPLNATKARLDTSKNNLIAKGETLDRRESAMEQSRLDLVSRGKALDQKEDDLKWARESLNEQTLKWAADSKKNTARLEELAAQLNALIARVSQLNGPCEAIAGVGSLSLGNLNGPSEQASRCLQQLFDGADRGNTAPVAPR